MPRSPENTNDGEIAYLIRGQSTVGDVSNTTSYQGRTTAVTTKPLKSLWHHSQPRGSFRPPDATHGNVSGLKRPKRWIPATEARWTAPSRLNTEIQRVPLPLPLHHDEALFCAQLVASGGRWRRSWAGHVGQAALGSTLPSMIVMASVSHQLERALGRKFHRASRPLSLSRRQGGRVPGVPRRFHALVVVKSDTAWPRPVGNSNEDGHGAQFR